MIASFRCKETEGLFDGRVSRKIAVDCSKMAQRKLQMLHAAVNLEDLRVPPGHHLEALSKDRKGQHSIRINSRWRICFVWNVETGNADDVEIVDYH